MVDESFVCRGCGASGAARGARCLTCGSGRIVRHAALFELTVAHVDCDAFYAAVEKRDDPSLADRPVIVGGGRRGVVSTCCYIARTYGVRSAMPMYKALALCPDAAVVRPDMEKYAAAAGLIREKMRALTPLVEPLSIDEAFLDLAGAERVNGAPAAVALVRLQNEIERDVGVTVSIGLAPNKFVAKIAGDLDKPRGFSVVGPGEMRAFLARLPASAIWGVGPKTSERLAADGFRTIADLQRADATDLARRYGDIGLRLARLAVGDDRRRVDPEGERKSVSAETTFDVDIAARAELDAVLWRLCEKVSAQLKAKAIAGRTVVLKMKDSEFRLLTRRATLERPTNLARILYDTAAPLLAAAADGRPWRLIGVGAGDLVEGEGGGNLDFFSAAHERRIAAQEAAMDAIREKFGDGAIRAGRGWRNRR